MSNEAGSAALSVPIHASMWAAACAGALAVGAIVVAAPAVLLALLGLCALLGFVALSVRQPRAAVVLLLLLLVAYVPDVAGEKLGLPVSSQALIAVLVIVVLAQPAMRENLRSLTREAIGFAALLLTMVFSAALASSSDVAMTRVVDQAKDALLVFLFLVLVDRAAWLRRAMLAFASAGVVLAALTVVQQWQRAYDSDFGGFAVVSAFGDSYRSEGPLSSNYFGQMLVVSVVLLLYLSTIASRSSHTFSTLQDNPSFRLARIVGVVGISLCAVAIAFTLSRGSVLALAVALVTIAVLRRWRMGALLVTGLVVATSIVLLPQQFKERWFALANPTATDEVDLSTRQRLGENLAAVEMFEDHPLIGVGPGNFEVHYLRYSQGIALDTRDEPRQPHSLYLEVLAERGILGTIPFVAFMIATVLGAWRAMRRIASEERALAEAAFVALIAVLVSALFLHAAYARYFWITVSFALVSSRIATEQRTSLAAGRPA